jgi:hypothetical protein
MGKRWRDIVMQAFGGGVERVRGPFVMDAEWERCEELRPDRLGPSEDTLRDEDEWRPRTTLG